MNDARRFLIAGESWITHSIHQKGFDAFTTTSYHEGVGPLRAALEAGPSVVDYLPNHLAASQFPLSCAELDRYDAVILSDIGANTLQLHPDTFERSTPLPDRLEVLREYVARGGGLIMVGGYLSFQGIDGRARYAATPLAEVLPVCIQTTDDRVEMPAGRTPIVANPAHPIVANLPSSWPSLLGYNRVEAKPLAELVVTIGHDPLIVAGPYQAGRSVAFTSDCGPHWCPPPFVEWDGYGRLWRQLAAWAAGAH